MIKEKVILILSTILASVLTYLLSIRFHLGPFIASGLVGLISTKVLKKFSSPMYAASFASMSSSEVLPSVPSSGVAGLITGILYILTQKVFVGIGGKLGAIAFLSVLIISLFVSEVQFSQNLTYLEGLYLILGSSLGAVLTYSVSTRFKQNPVFSSSIVVLTAALISNISLRYDNLVAAITCGTYAGMSSEEVIGDLKRMFFIGGLAGIILFLSWPLFSGVGGKLGLIAFLAIFLCRLFSGMEDIEKEILKE